MNIKLASSSLLLSLITVPALANNVSTSSSIKGAQPNIEMVEEETAAEKAAKELANPNTAYASLNLKLQHYSGYKGGGSSTNVVFQPTMPFPLKNGDKVIFRPAVSYINNDITAISNEGGDDSGFSDIAFDLAYAPQLEGGNIAAFGVFASVPTGSDGFSSEQFAIGPELMVGKASANRVIGAFPNHLYGVSGEGAKHSSTRINKTSAQLFWVEILGGGWTVGSAPTLTYDWTNDRAEIPINMSVTKTIVMGGRPWKLGLEANYYVEKAENRPDFMLGFNVSPVVENQLANLLN